MTISDLRVLIDNLDEYIHIPGGVERLKKTVLHLALSGQLVPQIANEGTGKELYEQIQVEKNNLLKKQKAITTVGDDEIPFDIPDTWRWVRVSDMGYSLGQKRPDKEFYYIDVASIDNTSQQLTRPTLLTAKSAPSRARKIVKVGTVIYSTVRPYLLNTTVIQENFDKELIASTAFAILHPFSGVDSRWILFNLTSQYFTDYINKKSVGAAYPAINDAQFSMAAMPLPPLGEQKRIVERVDEIFALIDELNNKYQAEEEERRKFVKSSLRTLAYKKSTLALDSLSNIIRTKADAAVLRKAILRLAVSGRLVPQTKSEGSADDLYEQILTTDDGKKSLLPISKDEELFDIPSNWKWIRLGAIAWLEYGVKSKGETLNYLEAKYMRGTKDPLTKDEGVIVEKNQRLILVDGENSGEVFVSPERGYMGSTFKILGQSSKVYDGFINIIMINFKQEMKENKIGIAIPHLDKKLFTNKVVGLPPLAEQKRIVAKTNELLNLVTELEKHLDN